MLPIKKKKRHTRVKEPEKILLIGLTGSENDSIKRARLTVRQVSGGREERAAGGRRKKRPRIIYKDRRPLSRLLVLMNTLTPQKKREASGGYLGRKNERQGVFGDLEAGGGKERIRHSHRYSVKMKNLGRDRQQSKRGKWVVDHQGVRGLVLKEERREKHIVCFRGKKGVVYSF